MAFRGQPQTIDEVLAWVQEQLRAVQAPAAGGSFVGPPGPPGATGPQGLPGAQGPQGVPDPDQETIYWSTVNP